MNDTRPMPSAPVSPLLRRLRAELARVGEREKAPRMQAYMKSAMPFHGVPSPRLKVVARAVFADLALPSLEAWRGHVLDLASDRIGPILLAHPAELAPAMRAWSHSSDLWKRRASIISQLRFKERTDAGLLYDCIGPSIGSREFFLRKAIGWALREYANTDPEAVRRYVSDHEADLSGLSRREALRQIERRLIAR